MDELDYEVTYLVTKTVPAACPCCKDRVVLEAGDLVTLVAMSRDGTVEVETKHHDYVECHPEVLRPWV